MRWLIVVLVLAPLVRRNYRARERGLAPDEWYWADTQMVKWGYFLTWEGKLVHYP